jgi:hypothetical protein
MIAPHLPFGAAPGSSDVTVYQVEHTDHVLTPEIMRNAEPAPMPGE